MKLKLALPIAALVIASSLAAATNDRLLSAVPENAVAVGVIHLDQLRNGSFASRLFNETNKATIDGEAEKFLRETGLDMSKDIDTIAFALSANSDATDGRVLVAAEGRFDVNKLSAAVASRGAVRQENAGKTYFVIPETNSAEERVAVAFVDKRLVLAGHLDNVRDALSTLAAGGGHFRESSGLAADLSRIPNDASCWMITDVQRAQRLHAAPKAPAHSPMANDAFMSSMKMLQTVSLWAKDDGDDLTFGGTAVSADEPTRTNIADMLRGMTAAWRMAAQEKKPELVNVIRGFKVSEDGSSVSLRGSIPTEMLREFARHGQIASRQ